MYHMDVETKLRAQFRQYFTHLSRMDMPTIISRTSQFPILGVLGAIFHFIQILIEHYVSKQWRP